MRRSSFVLATLVALVAAPAARANITYQYVTDASSYTGSGTQTVTVYLQELGSTSANSLLAGGNTSSMGLASFAFYVTQTGGSGTSTVNYGSAAPNTTYFNGPTGTSSQGSLPANSLDFNGNLSLGSKSSTGAATAISGGYEVAVATFTVTVGSGAATSFAITSANSNISGLADLGDGAFTGEDSTFTLPNSTTRDLDSNGQTSGSYVWTGADNVATTFTVGGGAAVPEPSSIALCGILAVGGALGAYRRRQQQKAAVAELV